MNPQNQGADGQPKNDLPPAQPPQQQVDPRDTEIANLKKEMENRDTTIGSLKRDLTAATKKKDKAGKNADDAAQDGSSELDLAREALLAAHGLKDSAEQKLALDFAERTGDKLTDVLSDEIFKGRLEKHRTTTNNAKAAGDGSNRGAEGGGDLVAKTLAKLGPNDPVPADLPRDVREKVVEARRQQGKGGKVFYND